MKPDDLEKKAKWLRRKILDMTIKAGAGHVAPSMSCAEILVALHYNFLRLDPNNPKWEDRDRFILSKGQAAVALYAVLADLGFFPKNELMTFTQKGSQLGGHTEDTIPGVEVFTGSLGLGFPVAVGMALGAKMNLKDYFTVALLGDAELMEGSIWEAAMFASHHRLNNLIAIVDRNGLSATDFTESFLELNPVEEKWESFGWDVISVDGHSFDELNDILSDIRSRKSNKPLAIIAYTIKGKGISFMENKPIYHYRIPQGKEIEIAYGDLDGK